MRTRHPARGTWRGRRVAAPALAAVAALAWLLLGPWMGFASAHAALHSTSPADGEQLERAPDAVILTFNEPVAAGLGAVRVFDAAGERVDTGEVVDEGAALSAGLQPDLRPGTYVVSWRVTSADAHPIRGALTFAVGEPVAGASAAQLDGGGSDAGLDAFAAVVRWGTYATTLLVGGVVAFLLLVDPGRGGERRVLRRLVTAGAVAALLLTAVGVLVHAALVTGLGVAAVVAPGVAWQVLTSTFGASAAVRVAGLGAMLAVVAVLHRPWGARLAVGAGAVAVASFVLDGHTATTQPRWLSVGADVAHLLAGAVWLGGLVALGIALRRRRLLDDPVGGARLVSRFANLALAAVAGVSVTGVALAWTEVRALSALTTTAYGQTLLVKVALVAAVLAVASRNHRRLVPAVAKLAVPSGGAVETMPAAAPSAAAAEAAWRRLRTTVTTEVAGLVVVLGVTAVLVNLLPAKQAAGLEGPFSATVPFAGEQLQVTIDPNRAGVNELHLYLLDDAGRPVDAVEELTLSFSQPAREIAAIERQPSVAGPGHWTMTGAELSIPGRWIVTATAPVSRFEEVSAALEVEVNP